MTDRERLLRAIAAELARVASDVTGIGSILSSLADRSPPALRAAQDTDRLAQTLTALSSALEAAAGGAEPEAVTAAVPLAGLAARLSGAKQSEPVSGEVDLF